MKKFENKIAFLAVFLLAISLVSAFGVGSVYTDEFPIKMYPGERAILNLDLANSATDPAYTFVAEMRNGGGVANLVHEDPTYVLSEGVNQVDVPIEVIIPSNAKIGDYFEYDVGFKQLPTDAGVGSISVVGGMNMRVGIKVVEEGQHTLNKKEVVAPVETTDNSLWYIILAIVIVIAVLYFVTRNKETKKKK